MKNLLFLLILLVFSLNTEAQDRFYFIGAEAGAMPLPDGHLLTSINISSGFNIRKKHRLGVELRNVKNFAESEVSSTKGIGIKHYWGRRDKFTLITAVGRNYNFSESNENISHEGIVIIKKGFYWSEAVGYTFKNGIFVGFNISSSVDVMYKFIDAYEEIDYNNCIEYEEIDPSLCGEMPEYRSVSSRVIYFGFIAGYIF